MAQGDIKAALKVWREGLVGLTKQSALIKFRATKTSSLLIDSPGLDDVLDLLRSGTARSIRGDAEAPAATRKSNEFLHSPRPDTEVGPVVRNLMRKASAEYIDRGLSVLYLAFGMLDWRDVDDAEMVSPILLVPVELVPDGPKATPLIKIGEDDSVLNPALALRLKEFGVELPTMDELDAMPVSELLNTIEQRLATNPRFAAWTLRHTVYLATFSFAKEAMFKDLSDNEAKILEHPVVQALATSDPTKQTTAFQFDPIDAANIDTVSPPEVTPLVLDADSSQRAAVAAALAGSTFVIDGPPGTGKSQTIANMIGALLHSGKTVLFVSEKIAALEVVRNRLDAAGLGSYLLELHSHKVNRKEVATELLKTLDNIVKPPVSMSRHGRKAAKDHREQLTNYTVAMNEVRQPLNMSLHHALGLFADLAALPAAPAPERAPTSMSEAEYLGIQESLAKLVRSWRPAVQGKSFLWREVADDKSLDVRLYQAETALAELRGTVALNAGVLEAFNLTKPSDTPLLVALVEHQSRLRPGDTVEDWLTATSMSAVDSARAELGRHIDRLKAAEDAVVQSAGVSWRSFPDPESLPPNPAALAVGTFPIAVQTLPTAELTPTADRFEADAQMLSDRLGALNSLSTAIGLGPVSTFADAERVVNLVSLRSLDIPLDRRWLTPAGLAEARAAAAALREHVNALNDAEATASAVFTPDALQVPLAELQDRFTNLHKGLKKLSGSYRADKRTVAGLLNDAADVKNGIKHLADAVAWCEEKKAFEASSASSADLLGAYWSGRDTDFGALNTAFKTVDEILSLVGGTAPQQLITYMVGRDSNAAYQTVADTARAAFDGWKRGLQPSPAPAGRPELLLKPVEYTIDWLTAHVKALRSAAARVSAVASVARGGVGSLADANRLLTLVESAAKASAEMMSAEPAHRAVFGTYFDLGDTNLDALDETIEWARHLRTLVNGPLNAAQVKALAQAHQVDGMAPAYEKWTAARNRVVDAFEASRRGDLIAEFDDYRGAVELINDFRDDSVGQQEWFEYRRAYTDLAGRGLDTAVDFCVEQRLAEDDVPKVVNRALLHSWSDAVIQSDERLRPLRSADREALVDAYRNADQNLIKAATADIITAANARRPANTTIGESGLIRREGSKQKRHMPVRELISRTRNVTTSIKPVFMMSPLAVSQYLPCDMDFDIVIFDEASQVTPGDAINCVYRGKALILAGDDKQLPPTSFFERNTDDDDEEETDVKDFQSVLELAKASGAFNTMGLSWHYRSRHEDLIAFSNYKFYDGSLVTFPSAHAQGDDVGVEFFNAHGVYRRGGGSYNPIEAAKVAERVTEHFTKHPKLTLGVVTFSVAQADAVQNAIDEARVGRRDLDRFFDSEDRLNGFFIRALEQVQGDERDVIIFSVGYGPDEAGKISTNFGALNKDKGWRRLNVGITRARQRVEVVASMHAGQIPPSVNENVEYFRAYLDYAERGAQVLAVQYSSTGLDPESPFEESVLEAIKGWGYTVEPQVGAAGYRIDIGVRHPDYPGMFTIGVECDGYQYHSAPAARDRDRLRDQILTGLGWRLHRIWGTAWYRDRITEEKRLRAAIEESIAAPLHDRTKKAKPIERPPVETEQADAAVIPTWTTEYRIAPRKRLPRWVEPGEAGNHLHMVESIEKLADHEGPIHREVVDARLKEWWNVGRIGQNIRANIDRAISQSRVVQDGEFLLPSGGVVTQIRTPSDQFLRKVEHVHLDELGLAVVLTVRDAEAASRAEVIQCVARVFGWQKTSATVERRVGEAIDQLVADGKLVCSAEDTLTAPRG